VRRTKDNPRLCVHAEEKLGWACTFGGELDAVLQTQKVTVIISTNLRSSGPLSFRALSHELVFFVRDNKTQPFACGLATLRALWKSDECSTLANPKHTMNPVHMPLNHP